MATTRGWRLIGNINNAINYILDLKHGEEKTNSGIYTTASSGFGSPYRAGYHFKQKRINMENPSKNVGYHFQFSLPPGEGTPEECLAAAEEWIKLISNGKADYVIAVHTDTASIHAHIITDYYLKDGKPWSIFWKRDKKKFRAAADAVCRKFRFSVLEKTAEKGKTYFDWMQSMNPDSSRVLLKKILDYAIPRVTSFEELQRFLESLGFKVYGSEYRNLYSFYVDKGSVKKQPNGKYIVKVPNTNRFIEVDRAHLKWFKSNTRAKITLPTEGIVNMFNENMFFIGKMKVNDLKSDSKKEWEGKFVFTADIKLLHLREDGSYLVRIPYQKDFIRVSDRDMEWIKEGKTVRIVLPVDQKVMHYDEDMTYQDRITVNDLKKVFEEKNRNKDKQKKEKLRYKVPGGKTIIREESLEDGYTFNEIKEKIKKNGRTRIDPEVEATINDAHDYEKTEAHRKFIYDFADIHTNNARNPLYKSQKQENYFKWKESQIDRMVDQINRDTLAKRDLSNLDDLKEWRDDLQFQLKDCYQTMEEFDKKFEKLMEEFMESKNGINEESIDDFVRNNRGALQKQAEEIKSQIKDCNYRIKEAEQYEKMQKKQNRERTKQR